MKKNKNKNNNDAKLLKKAMVLGFSFAKKQGYGDLEKTVSSTERVECIYHLLTFDEQTVNHLAHRNQQADYKLTADFLYLAFL